MKSKHYYKLTMVYLILVSLIDFMGLGIVVTLFPKLLLDPSMGILPTSWSMSARLLSIGCFLATYPLGQFFGAAVFGKLSDHYGRKLLLTLTLLGTIFGFSLSAISILMKQGILLLIGRLIAGVFAGNTAIAQASMIDISKPETKARNISILQITLGFAWVIGPAMGGWLSQKSIVSWFNYSTPFWIITLLLLLMLFFNIVFYRETLVKAETKKIKWFENLSNIHEVFANKGLYIAFIVWSIFVCGWWLFEAYLPTYLQQHWQYNSAMIGTFLACMGAGYATTQLLVLRIIPKFNPYSIVRYSLIISGIAVVAITLVYSQAGLITVIAFYVLSMSFALPGLITNISNLGHTQNQGHIMGMMSSVQAISTVLMMLIGGGLVSINENIPIAGGGMLIIVAWILFTIFFRRISSKRVPKAVEAELVSQE